MYAGHYGPEVNLKQVQDGVAAIDAIRPGSVRGFRLPYGHFNEYSYGALAQLGLTWSSNVSGDDFVVPGNGYGFAPFQMRLGEKNYPIVEIPLDSQTYDWSIWMADDAANGPFVESVRRYCALRDIAFERTPRGGVAIWRQRSARRDRVGRRIHAAVSPHQSSCFGPAFGEMRWTSSCCR